MQPHRVNHTSTERHALNLAMRAQWPLLWRAWVLSLICGLLVLAPMLYMFQVYGGVVESRSPLTLLMLFVILLWALVVLSVMDWYRSKLLRACGQKIEAALQVRVFDATVNAQLVRGKTGWGQPLHDLRVVREVWSNPGVNAFMELPLVVMFLLMLYWVHPMLALTSLVCVMLQASVGAWFLRRGAPHIGASQSATAKSEVIASNMQQHHEVVHAMGMLDAVDARWRNHHRASLISGFQAARQSLGLISLSKALQVGLGSVLLGLSAWFLLEHNLSGGSAMMIVASTLGGRVLAPFSQLFLHARTLVNAKDAAQRLASLLTQTTATTAPMSLPAPQGHLLVESLSGGAPNFEGSALRGIQFELKPGEVLAVMGATGSGKSTLAHLLLGVWPALAGKVRLDGADIALWPRESLGPSLGYVPQSIELMEGTVWDNLTRFDGSDLSTLNQVLQTLPTGWLDFVQDLPEGWLTQVGRGGEALSTGQSQRLIIARALYGQPTLVIMDEPNSALDDAADRQLGELVLAHKARGCTFVVMTHRMSLVNLADKVLWLERGLQKQFGSKDAVIGQMRAGAST